VDDPGSAVADPNPKIVHVHVHVDVNVDVDVDVDVRGRGRAGTYVCVGRANGERAAAARKV
jgi:hypothetical protein